MLMCLWVMEVWLFQCFCLPKAIILNPVCILHTTLRGEGFFFYLFSSSWNGFLLLAKRNSVCCPSQSYSRNIKALLLRPDWEKVPREFCAPPVVAALAFPHFFISSPIFSGLLVFSPVLCTQCAWCCRVFHSMGSSTDSPITLAELGGFGLHFAPVSQCSVSSCKRACFFDFGPVCCSVNLTFLVGSRKVRLLFFCLFFLVKLGVMLFLALYMPLPLFSRNIKFRFVLLKK